MNDGGKDSISATIWQLVCLIEHLYAYLFLPELLATKYNSQIKYFVA